jgi:hypothetical protein
MRTDLKKGPKRFRSDPFTTFEMVPNTGNPSATRVLTASALTHRVRLLDCRLMVPGAANSNFAHARGGKIGGGLGFVLVTSANARAAANRELVDLGGPVIQTRIHHRSPCVDAPCLMLRPTRSRLVTETDIVRALRQCNMLKTNSFPV